MMTGARVVGPPLFADLVSTDYAGVVGAGFEGSLALARAALGIDGAPGAGAGAGAPPIATISCAGYPACAGIGAGAESGAIFGAIASEDARAGDCGAAPQPV